MFEKVAEKSPFKFFCEKCNYGCNKNSDFNKHLATAKHNVQKCSKMFVKSRDYSCNCGKEYKYKQSLNRHKKICTYEETTLSILEKMTNRL